MCIALLKKRVQEILHSLEMIPLSTNTVRYYCICYRTLLHFCEKNDISEFSQKHAEGFFASQQERVNRKEINHIYCLIMRKAAFVLADYFDTGVFLWKRRNYDVQQLSPTYQDTLSLFEKSILGSLSEGSSTLVTQATRRFLLFLEQEKCFSISEFKIDHVHKFIIREAPNHSGNMVNLTWPMKRFLVYLKNLNLISFCADMLLANPVPNRKKVLPCLENYEIEAIFSAVDTTTELGKRDFAIMKLALFMGLRCVDIVNMKLSDIDWKIREICIVQEKNQTALALPLVTEVGNAIADYILNARPKSDSPYIFLQMKKPYRRLRHQTTGANLIKRYQEKAGINHSAWDGKTFHAFRRTAGTNMICSGVPLTTVSQVLGHNSLESTKRYLSLHDEMLRTCCMDISMYSIKGRD